MSEDVSIEKLENGCLRLAIEHEQQAEQNQQSPPDTPALEHLESVLEGKEMFLALNLRAIGEEPEQHELTDLFADIAEIRSDNSMSLIGPKSFGQLTEPASEFIQQDCGIFLVPEGSVATFPDRLKLFLPWILRPSLFDFNLRNSPGYLPEQIFEVIKFAIYFLPAEDKWYVMSLSEDIEMFAEALNAIDETE